MRLFLAAALTIGTSGSAMAQSATPNQGYYQGSATLYPYKPVYCDDASGRGPCYGSPGDMVSLPKSAPLLPTESWCVWADASAGLMGDAWYQWPPRITAADKVKFIGPKVCYFEDRGQPKNINDLKREGG